MQWMSARGVTGCCMVDCNSLRGPDRQSAFEEQFQPERALQGMQDYASERSNILRNRLGHIQTMLFDLIRQTQCLPY